MANHRLNWLDDDQIESDQDEVRYIVTGEDNGTWTIFDRKSRQPAILGDQLLVELTFELADDMVELMNQMEADAKPRPAIE